jgi:hypothetical protein
MKSGTFTAAPGSRYEHDLDVIPGDSGAGTYDNGDSRCNGIQSTQWRTTSPPRVCATCPPATAPGEITTTNAQLDERTLMAAEVSAAVRGRRSAAGG